MHNQHCAGFRNTRTELCREPREDLLEFRKVVCKAASDLIQRCKQAYWYKGAKSGRNGRENSTQRVAQKITPRTHSSLSSPWLAQQAPSSSSRYAVSNKRICSVLDVATRRRLDRNPATITPCPPPGRQGLWFHQPQFWRCVCHCLDRKNAANAAATPGGCHQPHTVVKQARTFSCTRAASSWTASAPLPTESRWSTHCKPTTTAACAPST